jgi:hypothetical protein
MAMTQDRSFEIHSLINEFEEIHPNEIPWSVAMACFKLYYNSKPLEKIAEATGIPFDELVKWDKYLIRDAKEAKYIHPHHR